MTVKHNLRPMIRNYLKAAVTDIVKNKYFSSLNILGLALGISVCMVIITIINNQLNYDSFHPHPERTYRINTEVIHKTNSREDYATSPFPLAGYLKSNYPFVQDAVNLTGGLSGDANINEKTTSINGFFSDKSFFDVLGFKLKYGDEATSLNKPNSIILTARAAGKLFGENVNPLGQVLQINGLGDFIITGILTEPAGKTHLDFDAIGSDKELQTLEKTNKVLRVNNNWANYYSNYTYVLLKDKLDGASLEKNLTAISKTKYTGLQLESQDKGYKFYLQAINKIVPGPILSNNMGKALPQDVLWYLSIIGFVIILSAGFNYNSLSLARALGRSKEIGIRKSLGAKKYQLFVQFLVQSVFTSLIAMGIASFIFHFILRPFFENIDFFKSSDIVLYENLGLYLVFLTFSIIVGALAGVFPAMYLSSLDALKALKQNFNFNITPKLGFRKVLLTIQFAIALLFVVGLINIYREINYVLYADYGFRKDNIVNIDLQGNSYVTMRQIFSQVKGVAGISGSSHSIGTTRDEAIDVRIKKSDERDRIRDFTIDELYLDNFKLHLITGKNFSNDITGKETHVIVNEAFLKYFHLGDPHESLGKSIILGDSLYVTISGVLKDFNYQPLTKEIKPVIFRYNTAAISQLNILVDKSDVHGTVERLSKTWKAFDKTNLFKYSFLVDEMQQAYSMFSSVPQLLTIIAAISIIVASLGLLGLAVFLLNQRVKEISIRKILGANITEISFLLSRGFISIIARGLLIGLPIAIYLDTLFLKNFVYRINPVWGYLLAIVFLFVIVFLSIGVQIIKIAKISPVKSLRTE